jgi:hypothetical protein
MMKHVAPTFNHLMEILTYVEQHTVIVLNKALYINLIYLLLQNSTSRDCTIPEAPCVKYSL